MTELCLCEHSVDYHFMDFGKCTWVQAIPGGFVHCDCRIYEPSGDNQ